MNNYLSLLQKVIEEGKLKNNRTGIDTIAISGAMFQHDMQDGFPLLTTKKVSFKNIKVELEFFIKGLTDKKWLQERDCKIWNEWCNPQKIPNSLIDEKKKKFQLEENDLGKIYGYQWNNFNDSNINQLKNVIKTLKENPNDRRMMVSAWNPQQLEEMALPPCHFAFHITVIDKKLNLSWFQRSCDVGLGLPYNIASYGLLLHLLAKEVGFDEGTLTGFLSDVHIYKNHVDILKKQLQRKPYPLPTIETEQFNGIYQWSYCDTKLQNYQSHDKLDMPIAV